MSGFVAGLPVSGQRYELRLERSRARLAELGAAALLVGVGPDLDYLCGYPGHPSERLTMLVLPVAGPLTLVVPRLERDPASRSPVARAGVVEVMAWDETDDPHRLVATLVEAATGTDGSRSASGRRRVAIGDQVPALHLLRLQQALGDVEYLLGSRVTGPLRIVKDADEIELLRRAALAADRVVGEIAAGPLVGRSERDIAQEVRDRLIAAGHDAAAFAIVGSGPNSASPHHGASERMVAGGEPIVLDIGGILEGYGSDITRTIWVAGPENVTPDPEFLRMFELVRESQHAATAAIRPGVECQRLDAIARGVIEAGGHGAHFIHRLGHGIGLEGHEEPYLVAGNATPVAEGMTFSVEPGIYLDGRYGVRLEDIVACGPDGAIVLNQAPHDLLVVRG